MDYCKFIHYELEDYIEDSSPIQQKIKPESQPSQWVCADLRLFDLRVLGK